MEKRDEERGTGIGEALLAKSLETAFTDPAMAVRLANLGVRLSLHLGEAPWGAGEPPGATPGGTPGGRNRSGRGRPAKRNPGPRPGS